LKNLDVIDKPMFFNTLSFSAFPRGFKVR